MKFNSELPKCMLALNTCINDYDFVLLHLYLEDEEYALYFNELRSRLPYRMMVLDNSAYEFFVKGEELDFNKFYTTIRELKPDYYILPDVLMDKEKTLAGTRKFLDEYRIPGCSKPMAVAQGDSIEDMIDCLEQYIEMDIDAVAIPFHNSFYREMSVSVNIANAFMVEYGYINADIEYAMGRVEFLSRIQDILKRFKHVHILGSHCPLEAKFYDYSTMDTGYPVKLAIVGQVLGKEKEKPNIIIDEFYGGELSLETKALIESNIKKMKGWHESGA